MSRLLYPRHRFAEKASLELDDLLQQLVERTGNDPDPEQEAQRAPGDYQIQNPFPPDDKELSFDDDDWFIKSIISLSHIFSLSSMCILQGRGLSPLCIANNVHVWSSHLLQLLSPPKVSDHRSGGAVGEQEGGARQRSSLKHLRAQLREAVFKGELQSRIEVQAWD